MRAIDSNGKAVSTNVRQENDGTWSANVWFGFRPATNVRRQYGYISKAAARAADISESVEQTNSRFRK